MRREARAETKELSTEGKLLDARKGLDFVADGKSERPRSWTRRSGTRFDIAGRGVEGELKGWTLGRLDARRR